MNDSDKLQGEDGQKYPNREYDEADKTRIGSSGHVLPIDKTERTLL